MILLAAYHTSHVYIQLQPPLVHCQRSPAIQCTASADQPPGPADCTELEGIESESVYFSVQLQGLADCTQLKGIESESVYFSVQLHYYVLGLIILFQLAVLSVAMLLHPLLDLRVTLPVGTKHTTEIRVLPAYRCVLASLFYNIHEGGEG